MKTPETARIGIKVKKRLLMRLQKHISDKNFELNRDTSQQEWIAKAIEEKLRREEVLGELNQNSLKLTHVSVPIAKELNQLLQKRFEELKSAYTGDRQKSYSKKSWLIEAIEEKLEQEESGN